MRGSLHRSALLLVLLAGGALAQTSRPLHPDVPFLDEDGRPVLESGGAISTSKSCAGCHDTAFIESHSFHATAGLTAMVAPGKVPGGWPWDTSRGWFGKWSPITYRYLTPPGEAPLDLGTPDWIRVLGARHVGGGPAVRSREGIPLPELEVVPGSPQTHVAGENGELLPWDWKESGVVEMNCFLCHIALPDNEARVGELREGRFRWAATATLGGTDIVRRSAETEGRWEWNREAFNERGELHAERLGLQRPTNRNCGQCHGLVKATLGELPVLTDCDLGTWSTATRGEIVSPQRIRDSGMNLKGKSGLSRTWDVHAERLVDCVNCHFSTNNPIYHQESERTRPEHLRFGARGLSISEYLQKPSHDFARGTSPRGQTSPFRRCESCHEPHARHQWLPYAERHFQEVSCEACHIPRMYSGSRRMYDWTSLTAEGKALIECRGFEGDPGELETLIAGFQPILLQRRMGDGRTLLAPYNLIASWFWVSGDPPRPVPLADLQRVFLEGERHAPEIVAAFDEDGDGALSKLELRLDRPEKVELVRGRLASLGLVDPRIEGDVEGYAIHHDVTTGAWATRDCATCHADDSRVSDTLHLADYLPGGVLPEISRDGAVVMSAAGLEERDGGLSYRAGKERSANYVLGHHRSRWVDWSGFVLFLLVLAGIAVHATFRFVASRRRKDEPRRAESLYLFTVYERLWHWLQATAILLLIVTGLAIHAPTSFRLIPFEYAVPVHNALALVLLVNAALAGFYHLASGEIRQFLPRPQGFFSQAIEQAAFYLRGVFHGAEHPFQKSGERKLNPLQQITYLAILNVLLPLQLVTGVLMWGAQRWPDLSAMLGGLAPLGMVHTLLAWLFATFLVMHIYLTTMGPTPLAGIRSMLTGWEGEPPADRTAPREVAGATASPNR